MLPAQLLSSALSLLAYCPGIIEYLPCNGLALRYTEGRVHERSAIAIGKTQRHRADHTPPDVCGQKRHRAECRASRAEKCA